MLDDPLPGDLTDYGNWAYWSTFKLPVKLYEYVQNKSKQKHAEQYHKVGKWTLDMANFELLEKKSYRMQKGIADWFSIFVIMTMMIFAHQFYGMLLLSGFGAAKVVAHFLSWVSAANSGYVISCHLVSTLLVGAFSYVILFVPFVIGHDRAWTSFLPSKLHVLRKSEQVA